MDDFLTAGLEPSEQIPLDNKENGETYDELAEKMQTSPIVLTGNFHETIRYQSRFDMTCGVVLRVLIRGGALDTETRDHILRDVLFTNTFTSRLTPVSLGCGAVILGEFGLPMCDPRHGVPQYARLQNAIQLLFASHSYHKPYCTFPVTSDEEDPNDFLVDVPLIVNASDFGCVLFQTDHILAFDWTPLVKRAVKANNLVLKVGCHMGYLCSPAMRLHITDAIYYGMTLRCSAERTVIPRHLDYVQVSLLLMGICKSRVVGIMLTGQEFEPPDLLCVKLFSDPDEPISICVSTPIRLSPYSVLNVVHLDEGCSATSMLIQTVAQTEEHVVVRICTANCVPAVLHHGSVSIREHEHERGFWDFHCSDAYS